MNVVSFVPRSSDPDAVVHKFAAKSLKTPFSVEMLYLPYVLFRYRVDWTTLAGKEKNEPGLFLADLLQGLPMNIQKKTKFELPPEMEEEFAGFAGLMSPARPAKRTVSLQRSDIPDDKILPAALEEKAAIERGKSVFKYDLMRVMGGLRFRKIGIVPLPETKILYYPFWLVYHKDKKGKMRFEVFDALTGQKEKGPVVQSIKLGLIKKRETK
jgi:hypothetical protein